MLPRKMFLDDMLDNYFEKEGAKMKCDIYETDNTYNLVLDMPGYSKEDIKIECDNGTITINAERNEEDNDESKKYIRRERFYGKLSRSFYLGEVDEDGVKAEFKDGTLKVVAPKKSETFSKKVINID